MSGYKNFAVVGAGNLGKFILNAFAAKFAEGAISSVTLLTRSSKGHEDVKAKGVKVIAVDYSSLSLSSSLSNIDVVISTIADDALHLQINLALAAQEAGVKLFIPSEFGLANEGLTDGVYIPKNELKTKLKETGLPYTLYYTGPFTDFVLEPGFAKIWGFDFADGKAKIHGNGSALISWTTCRDISQFVVHSLTEFAEEDLHWKTFAIEGDRISLNQLVEQWNTHTGKKLSVTHIPISVDKEELIKNPSNFLPLLNIELDSGHGTVTKTEGELANNLWPEWRPAKVLDVLKDIYQL